MKIYNQSKEESSRHRSGSIEFLLYINGLLQINTKDKLTGFADDTAILYEWENWDDLKAIIEEELIKILNFLHIKHL